MKVNVSDIIPEISNKLPNGYSVNARKEAENLVVNDQAPNRVLVEGITIDGKESRDLDDGMWAERMSNWWYMLQVSIADPSEIIAPMSAIDLEAMKKTTSIYLSTHTIHMLPPKLSTDLVSLNHNQSRLSQTVQIEFNSEMNVIKSDIFESKFYNQNRFNYESFSSQFESRDSAYHNQLDLLYEIAKKLYNKRMDKWAADFDESDRRIWWGKIKKFIASLIVQEAAIAANIEASIFAVKNNVDAIHRNHMPEYRWIELPKNPDLWERAVYSSSMKYHRWLAEEYYTHFTSPIRRLADLIFHRQIKAFMRWNEFIYKLEDIDIIIHYINTQRWVLEILWRNHNYNAWILGKQRGVKRHYERVKEKNSWFKVYHIKEDIRKWVKHWLRLPKEVRKEIIDQIENAPDIESWIWSLGVFLVSSEKEIIQTLKDRVLNYPYKSSKKFLGVIWQTIILRKEDKIISVEESERKVKWQIEIKWQIRYLWETIIKIKNIVYEDELTRKRWVLRKNLLEEVFEYFLRD